MSHGRGVVSRAARAKSDPSFSKRAVPTRRATVVSDDALALLVGRATCAATLEASIWRTASISAADATVPGWALNHAGIECPRALRMKAKIRAGVHCVVWCPLQVDDISVSALFTRRRLTTLRFSCGGAAGHSD
jgi:hypothetical protein